jgi:signal transduction histidine kinase/ligand-binding sensor domain-containing protein/DNA-binding response OmpR family regulator
LVIFAGIHPIQNQCNVASTGKWKWLLGVCLGVCSQALWARPDIRFEEVYSINSLSNNMVTCIHQDQRGFLWIGTFNGLNKYDGYSFRVYKFNDLEGSHASTNRIVSIHEDRYGRLWIETFDGNYQCFNPLTEKFTLVPLETTDGVQPRFIHLYESASGIICLSTDRSGVLFICSEGLEGECEITHLVNEEGKEKVLNSNRVNFVTQDRNGYFWIGTDNGLSRIHEEDLQVRNPRVLKYFSGEFTRAQIFDSKVWFANRESGLTWYDPANESFSDLSDYPELKALRKVEVTAIESRGASLWIGTTEGTLVKYDRDRDVFSSYQFTDPRSGNIIDEIHCDLYGQVWLLTEGYGITRFDPETGRFRYYRLAKENTEYLIDDERTKVFEDSNDELWLAGQNIGVQLYNREEDRFTRYLNNPGDPTSIQSSVVEFIVEDRENNVWLGTNWFGKGLSRMISVDPAFHYVVPVPEPENKMQNVVRSVFIDSEGYVWTGTKSGQIYIYDRDLNQVKVIQKDPRNRYSGYNVYSIEEDREGRIWLCTKGAGIFVSDQSVWRASPDYNRLTFTNIRHDPDLSNSLNNNNVYDIEFDKLGRIWVATYGGGLNMIDTGEEGERVFYHYTTGNSTLTSDNLRDLHIDRNGRLWMASTIGVNYVDIYSDDPSELEINHIISAPVDGQGLSYNDIIMIMEDTQGHLWLASAGGGVNQILNPGEEVFRFTHYSVTDGLKDDYILSLTEDMYGFIWIGTGSGLSRFNPVNGDIENFDKKAGLPEVFFSERTAATSPSGNLLFGTVNGFYSISPDRISREEIHPTICLTGLQLNNAVVVPGDPDSPLDRSIAFTDHIRLSSRQSTFSITFSLLSFRSPESNHYAYMLEGFDEKWNYIGTEHKATFTYVPPGNYTFRVKGLDSDLSEYGTEATLDITVTPPIWKTRVAFAVYALVLLSLVLLTYRVALRFMHLKSNLKVEKMVAESKLRFFTNISHEIRTPLTLILGPVEKLVSQKNLQADVRRQLSVVHRNSKRLLRMVNMILDFRKGQHEKINLRIQEIELIPFLHQVYESFEAQAKQKKIQFHLEYDHSDEHMILWGDIQKLDIVIFNLLSNAFKFTPENNRISIRVSRESGSEGWIRIVVSDTGIGIARDKLDRVFDRFFVSHTESGNEYQGTGIGLSLSQEYVNLHGGEISVESTPGEGTAFTVRLRSGREHFPDDVVIRQREAYSHSPKVHPDQETGHPQEAEDVDEEDFRLEEKPLVLVVEDDVEMCFYLQKILEKEYKVELAKDGYEGLERARKLSPDLVVTDVMMPGMNGIEMTEKLKDEFSTCHIPVIMLTSRSSVESQVEGLKTGAEAYVPKPFSTDVLLSYIQSLLRQRKKIRTILESRVELKPDEVQVTPRDKEFIEMVLGLINENLSDPEFNVEKLASQVYISRSLFYKKIKGITGYQPVELIRMMRLKKAAKYIETGEFTVSEIAYMVGYNDIKYFSTSFKKQFGISPSQYQMS